MVRAVAASCALLLSWLGYALACSPDIGDPWFNLSVTVNPKTLPKGFVLKPSSIENVAERDCVLADGTQFQSYTLRSFEAFAKNRVVGDGRPAHVKLPKPDTVKLEVHCDRQRYVTHGSFSYRRMDRMPDTWTNHMDLDLTPVTHLITAEASLFGTAVGDLLINRVEPAAAFCMMSAQQLFHEQAAGDSQVWGHGALSLARLAGARKHIGIDYSGHVTDAEAAKTKTFEVYLDCYTSKNIIEATVRYALNKSYDPTVERRSAEACSHK